MQFARWTAACAVAVILLWPGHEDRRPLWPGARYQGYQRDRAIERGLQFIYKTARQPKNFAAYGEDYLWCFRCVSLTSANPALRRIAWNMGHERAAHWRRDHPNVPEDASAYDIYTLVSGNLGADVLGVPDPAMKDRLRRAAARFQPEDFLDFDPAKEPVPLDIPDACPKCGTNNPRGCRVCEKCGTTLTMESQWDVLLDTLVETYTGETYGVRLGANYADVLQWLPRMRPYRGREGGKNTAWGNQAYAITHVIYTLNDYSRYRLLPAWLPQEFEFLKANLSANLETPDPETMGEFLDTLKSFGLTSQDPLIRTGMEFVLSKQNPDGSWGDPAEKDIYNRYHPTWTAVDGLRDYAWQGERVSFPEALRRIQQKR
jgi:hypothetical protein